MADVLESEVMNDLVKALSQMDDQMVRTIIDFIQPVTMHWIRNVFKACRLAEASMSQYQLMESIINGFQLHGLRSKQIPLEDRFYFIQAMGYNLYTVMEILSYSECSEDEMIYLFDLYRDEIPPPLVEEYTMMIDIFESSNKQKLAEKVKQESIGVSDVLPRPAWVHPCSFGLDRCKTIHEVKEKLVDLARCNPDVFENDSSHDDMVAQGKPVDLIFQLETNGMLGYEGSPNECIESFRSKGPVMDSECSDGLPCAMWDCLCNSCDEFDEEQEWFTERCEHCEKRILDYRYALRIPLEQGFKGCYCSYSCLQSGIIQLGCDEFVNDFALYRLLTQLHIVGISMSDRDHDDKQDRSVDF